MAHAATDPTQRTPAISAVTDVDPARLSWYVHVLHAADPAQIDTVLRLDGPIQIGREPPASHSGKGHAPAALVLNDPTVSRKHAVLSPVPQGRGGRLVDCGSSNGIKVDGRAVAESAVGDGTVVRMGDAVLLVQRGPRSPETEALGLIGRTPGIHDLRERLRKVAPSTLPVLVLGPTGSGKELVAHALHALSGRGGPFVALNCAALPTALVESLLFGHKKGTFSGAGADHEGAFHRADKGTLFLDEIGDMPLDVQPKLLRALETGEILPLGATRPVRVAVRVVVATHVPLELAVQKGHFRDDLLARLNGVTVRTSPLQVRRDDVLLLLRHFLPPSHRDVPLTADAAEALLLYPWPHNVRELHKLAQRLPVLHPDARHWALGMLDEAMQAAVLQRETPAAEPLERPPTHDELAALLASHDGNVSAVAAAVGRNRKQVYRWMEQHGLDRGAGRN